MTMPLEMESESSLADSSRPLMMHWRTFSPGSLGSGSAPALLNKCWQHFFSSCSNSQRNRGRSTHSMGAVRCWLLSPSSEHHFNPHAKGNLEAQVLCWWTPEGFSAWEGFVNDAIVIICMWKSLSFTYQFNAATCNSQYFFRGTAWRKTRGCSPSVLVSFYLLQNNSPLLFSKLLWQKQRSALECWLSSAVAVWNCWFDLISSSEYLEIAFMPRNHRRRI